jgi:hypothetical protein
MTAVLDELNLSELATSITGLSALGAAAILAETGDLTRFATARALVKHAGLAPREIMGSPARRQINPIMRCWDQPHYGYAETDDGRGTDQRLDTKRLTLMSERFVRDRRPRLTGLE